MAGQVDGAGIAARGRVMERAQDAAGPERGERPDPGNLLRFPKASTPPRHEGASAYTLTATLWAIAGALQAELGYARRP